jgi:hypothetical protein
MLRRQSGTKQGRDARQPNVKPKEIAARNLIDSGRPSGSGGGIRERALLARTTKRSFVANPRPPGYERGTGDRGFFNVLGILRS